MSVKQFTADSRTTINWANGTSTEIFIHPSDGSFADRRFLFRISTATVETEESTFTFFEGITRHLMILKGKLELTHEGHYTKHLGPYEQDIFSGEWNTRSKGRVTDFNLMLKNGITGSLTHYRLEPGSSALFISKADRCFVYLASGTASFNNGDTVKAGDLLSIDDGAEIVLQADEPCDLIDIRTALK